MSSAFHPHTDGATECANCTIDNQSSEDSESIGIAVGTSEVDLSQVPADDVESAAGRALENGIKQVSVEGDDTGAEGEPAARRAENKPGAQR